VPGLVVFKTFESRTSASAAAADQLATLIRKALAVSAESQAAFVVSGGSTPGPCFDLLSRQGLDWSRVTVLPSDERWVPAGDPNSNEGLIRARLLKRRAAEGRVLSFFRPGIEAKLAPALIERDLKALVQPFSAVLLGMGEDGHFASLFPDFKDLKMALDPAAAAYCIAVKTAGSPHLRISLTLSALLNSVHTVLLIFGETKRAVFEAASAGHSGYPIESLLLHTRGPLTVCWAP
jgi:6-phosphogluconolactonase